MRLALLIVSLCCALGPAFAAYEAQEMFVISWGDSSDQLKISLPFHEDVYGTPNNSTDDWVEYSGPKMGVVDRHENVIIASHFYRQLKGFDRTGRLIFDCSEGAPSYDPAIFKRGIGSIYVDSTSTIYVVDVIRYDYIAVVDTGCHLIDKITPYGVGSRIIVNGFSPGFNDVLSISCKDGSYFTYAAGKISSGGGRGWLARDGYYYYANLYDSTRIRFVRSRQVDINGEPTELVETDVPLPEAPKWRAHFLGIDDAMRLYVLVVATDLSQREVQIYDSVYKLIDRIVFPELRNKYMWDMPPFMRAKDGNIYEFRCLDDGLHVIRWSKEQ